MNPFTVSPEGGDKCRQHNYTGIYKEFYHLTNPAEPVRRKIVIYIDTGAFLARYIKRDQYHKQAGECEWKIRARPLPGFPKLLC